MSEAKLAGNGAELVRERALAARIQGALERIYRLDRVADVGDFLCRAGDGERESLLLREHDDGALEVGLQLPALCGTVPDANLDTICQIIEGVSHFVFVVERARTGRSTTQLELELQAEVDKWVVLAASMQTLDVGASAGLRARLYEQVSFAHSKESELGERYRVANDAAHRFVRRLERDYLGRARFRELRSELRFFFEVGQQDKLRLGRAA
ncbi:MAG TPA: hypothetical protein VGM06_03315 [Polyangiaceae bacterium]